MFQETMISMPVTSMIIPKGKLSLDDYELIIINTCPGFEFYSCNAKRGEPETSPLV